MITIGTIYVISPFIGTSAPSVTNNIPMMRTSTVIPKPFMLVIDTALWFPKMNPRTVDANNPEPGTMTSENVKAITANIRHTAASKVSETIFLERIIVSSIARTIPTAIPNPAQITRFKIGLVWPTDNITFRITIPIVAPIGSRKTPSHSRTLATFLFNPVDLINGPITVGPETPSIAPTNRAISMLTSST
mgnify:CR=1 FL=1